MKLRYDPIIQKISTGIFSEKNVEVFVLRLDLIHPQISGNKWFKLKYNLEEAKKQGYHTILTFGGAFSNHIHAAAVACHQAGFQSIGVIRGEKNSEHNFTLSEAKNYGMDLHFVSREDYRRKDQTDFIARLKEQFGDFYLIPEGGDNKSGEKGCGEILPEQNDFDYIVCAVGTGTTFRGIKNSLKPAQKLIGISVLKGHGDLNSQDGIIAGYHFGGYAKHTPELLSFKEQFENETDVPLDYVYTSKLFYAVNDLILKGKIPENSKVLVVHSGGLQGNKGYEQRYALKPSRRVNDIQGKE
jgi:1-aminocyclopropane-1-carboxylate deaminase